MAKPRKTLEELRETGRKRVERFHQAQEARGRKQISGFISDQAYDALCRIRDKTGESAGQIFENLLLKSVNKTVNINEEKKKVISPVKVELPEQETLPPYNTGEYKEYVFTLLLQLKKEGFPLSKATDHLNEKGIRNFTGKGKLNKGTISAWIKKNKGLSWKEL